MIATRVFGSRAIRDYESMRKRIATTPNRTPELDAEIAKWPPESYIANWIRELDRLRGDKVAPPTVHEFYHNGLIVPFFCP